MGSCVPPAENPTTMRTGRDGYSSADADCGRVGAAAAAPTNCRNCRRRSFMTKPPVTTPKLSKFRASEKRRDVRLLDAVVARTDTRFQRDEGLMSDQSQVVRCIDRAGG